MQRVDESSGWKPAESLEQTAARDPDEAVEKQLKAAGGLKEQGNVAFKAGGFDMALAMYDGAIDCLSGATAQQAADARVVLLQNKALCLLKLDRAEEAAKTCSAALYIAPDSTKALHRRAMALEAQGILELALQDFRRVLQLDKTEKASLQGAKRVAAAMQDAADARRKAEEAHNDPHAAAALLTEAIREALVEGDDAGRGERLAGPLKKLAGLLAARPAQEGKAGGLGERALEVSTRWAKNSNQAPLETVVAAFALAAKPQQGDEDAFWEEACDAALAVLLAVSVAADAGPAAVWAALEPKELSGEKNSGIAAMLHCAGGGCGGVSSRTKAVAIAGRMARETSRALRLVEGAWDVAAVEAIRFASEDDTDHGRRTLGMAGMELITCMMSNVMSGDVQLQVARGFSKARGFQALRGLAGVPGGLMRARILAAFKALLDGCGSSSDRETLVDNIVPAIKMDLLNASTPKERTRAAASLGVIAQAQQELRAQLLGNTAVLGALVALLGSEHPASVRTAASGALAVLAAKKEGALKIVDAGAADGLLFVTLDGSAAERAAAGVAMAKLSALNEDARELFVEHGGVAILLDIAVKGAASGDGDEAHVEEGEDASLATFEPLEAQRMAMEGVSVLCLTAKAENKAREQLLEEESLEAIRTLSKTEDHLVAYGLVSGLFNATRETKVVEGEEQEMLHRLKVATDNASRPKDVDEEMEAVYQERREREALTAEFRKGLVDAGIARELLCLTQKHKELSIHHLIAGIFVALTQAKDARGRLVQDGAMRALTALGSGIAQASEGSAPLFESEGAKEEAVTLKTIRLSGAHAIARICVSTDPHLFSSGVAHDCVPRLLLLADGEDELAQFEAALSLTNLASLNEETKDLILRSKGWGHMEHLASSNNEQVQRAATGALCNLVTSRLILSEIGQATAKGKRHVLIFLVLSQADDVETKRYATSAIANLASYPEAAKLIATGEGKGLEKLVGLLSSGIPVVVHPAAHAIAQLIDPSNPDNDAAWIDALLDLNILAPLILLQSHLAAGTPPHECIMTCLAHLDKVPKAIEIRSKIEAAAPPAEQAAIQE